ncbi:hypothetical protein CF326_g3317 [Tilletia indica]|nr:hypothetical protein CF326_g3317 [Tilletia indica]
MKSSLAAQLALLSDVAPVDNKDDAQDDLLRAFPVRSDQHQDMDDDFNADDDAEEEEEEEEKEQKVVGGKVLWERVGGQVAVGA